MSKIYKPKGLAYEYADYALNIYNGCTHKCKYCYVPQIMHRTREDFHDITKIKMIAERDKVIKQLPGLKGMKVLLSFISDPLQPIEHMRKDHPTKDFLNLFKEYGVIPVILTKGVLDCEYRDLMLDAKGIFGITFTGDVSHEKGCLYQMSRIDQIVAYKSRGGSTWISFEPIINWKVIKDVVHYYHRYIDKMYFGKLNYNKDIVADFPSREQILEELKEYKDKITIKSSIK